MTTSRREYYRQWRAKNLERARASSRKHAQLPHVKASRRAWEVANPHKRHGYHLKRRFGISFEDYQRLLRRQRGRCGICGGPPKRKWFDLDHDHVTGRIRGLLCNPCNRTLGHIERYLADPKRFDRWLAR